MQVCKNDFFGINQLILDRLHGALFVCERLPALFTIGIKFWTAKLLGSSVRPIGHSFYGKHQSANAVLDNVPKYRRL